MTSKMDVGLYDRKEGRAKARNDLHQLHGLGEIMVGKACLLIVVEQIKHAPCTGIVSIEISLLRTNVSILRDHAGFLISYQLNRNKRDQIK